MIEIVVEHILNQEGRQRFAEWIRRIDVLASEYPGFIDIRQMTLVDDRHRCFFKMRFDTQEQAASWVSSSDRQDALAMMEPYRVGELQASQWIVHKPPSPPA